jgi:hypothetical protein
MSYNYKICAIETSKQIQDMIDTCEEELREITAKKESTANNGYNIYNWTMRIEVLTKRLSKLKADLSRKKKEEEKMTSKKIEVSKKLAELKILFDT